MELKGVEVCYCTYVVECTPNPLHGVERENAAIALNSLHGVESCMGFEGFTMVRFLVLVCRLSCWLLCVLVLR